MNRGQIGTNILKIRCQSSILYLRWNMTIRQLRENKGLTQNICAQYLQIPLRTYKRYEADESKVSKIKYEYILQKLEEYGFVDEEHGVLTLEEIKKITSKIFPLYGVEYAYLFGSYAKGKQTEKSDVDLLVSVPLDGLKFFELVELLRQGLRKKVDLLDSNQLNNNPALMHEILKDGIKIYG